MVGARLELSDRVLYLEKKKRHCTRGVLMTSRAERLLVFHHWAIPGVKHVSIILLTRVTSVTALPISRNTHTR